MTAPRDMTATEAAQYCGLTRAGLIYHVQAKHLQADYRIGRNLMFTAETLDKFNAAKRKPGRPASGTNGPD